MKKLVYLIIAIVTVGLIPCWLQYGTFCVTTDFLNQQIGFILETKKMLASGVPFWSWNTFWGDNFLASYSFYTVTSPFVWINCMFPQELILFSITITLYLKFLCLGLMSYAYFRKINTSEDLSIIGALLYTFSSFVISNLGYYHFMEPIICFPLLLYFIERYFNHEKYSLSCLCLASFLVLFINFYFAICTFIAAAIYAFFKVIENKEEEQKARYIFVAIGCVIVGCLAASVVILPTVLHIAGSPRVEAQSTYTLSERIFATFIPKLRDGAVPFAPGTTNTSTTVNIAILGVFMAALYCKRKRNAIVYTLGTLFLMFLTPLNGIFSLFTNPDYTRWAYALTFILILASLKYIEEKTIIKPKYFWFYTSICITLMIYRYWFWLLWRFFRGYSSTNNELYYALIETGLILLSLIFLWYYIKKRESNLLIYLICIFSAIHLSCYTFVRSDIYSKITEVEQVKDGLFDIYVKGNQFPYAKEQKNYRTDFVTRNYLYYNNVCLLKNTPSISCYNSVFNNNVRELFQMTDSAYSDHTCSYTPTNNRLSMDYLMSVKYVVKYKDPKSNEPLYLDPNAKLIVENDNYTQYELAGFIPFGFTYESYILEDTIRDIYKTDKTINIPLSLLDNVAINEKDKDSFDKYLKLGTIDFNVDENSIVQKRAKNSCKNIVFNNRGFECTIDLDKGTFIFFSIPMIKGMRAFVDNQETQIYECNFGLSGIFIRMGGAHNIKFVYTPEGFITGLVISLISILMIIIIACYEKKTADTTQF